MILFTPEQKEKVARFAESLMTSEGVSTHTQRILIEIGRAVLRKSFEAIWLHPIEIINLGKSVSIVGLEELEYFITERLPKLFINRDEIDLGPIIVRRELRKDGTFYSFVRNFYSLDKISEYEDQMLEDADHGSCPKCRARQTQHD